MKTTKTELTQAELQAYQDIAEAARRLKKAQQQARARRRKAARDQLQPVGGVSRQPGFNHPSEKGISA